MESHCFPEGLGILIVDHDPQGLDSLNKMLLKCNYKSTLCKSAQEALHLLDTREDEFDLVLGDVDLPDMDGFEFLQHVVHKTDIPVIMMCDEGETSNVMKGVQHGACHCLLKPVRLKEIRNIWQHAFRKRMHKQDDNSNINTVSVGNKRKHANINTASVGVGADASVDPDPDPDPTPLNKKPRVVWTPELHQKFVNAVQFIGGLEKVGPKKILDLMGEPWLTRDNVASHLQKYRISVSRQKKEDELKASYSGMNHPEYSHQKKEDELKASYSGMNHPEYSHQNIMMNHNHNNQNDTSSIGAMPNDTGFYATPMVADERDTSSICAMPMVANQRWEYFDQPMVADQRWEYIDEPILVADQGIKFSDEPMDYSDELLEPNHNYPHAPRMDATDKNLCNNSLSISYAVGTMRCLW